MKIECVVFDMAGTTVDEDNIVYKTLHKALNQYNITVDLEHVLLHGAGKEKFQAIKDIIFYSEFELDELAQLEIFSYFLIELDKAYKEFKAKPIKGAEQVFKVLKSLGIKIVLNTGYNRKTAEGLLNTIGWNEGQEIDLLVTASDVLHNRPMPDMILFAKNALKISNSNKIVKIGDSCIDIEEGKNASCMYSIGITTGAQTRVQLMSAKPDYIIDDLESLIEILTN